MLTTNEELEGYCRIYREEFGQELARKDVFELALRAVRLVNCCDKSPQRNQKSPDKDFYFKRIFLQIVLDVRTFFARSREKSKGANLSKEASWWSILKVVRTHFAAVGGEGLAKNSACPP